MKKIIEVPYISQSPSWPTGCESVSAVMLLRHLGIDITVDAFIEKYLEKQGFTEKEGELFGPDPRKYFCGSPYDEDAYGCYAPVIRRALTKVFARQCGGDAGNRNGKPQYEAVDETGKPTEMLITDYIDRGMPVLCWTCIDMREPVTGPRWRLYDTGEVFTWISNEHCMLLVGYDRDKYYFNDPHNGNGLAGYGKNLFEKRRRAQHMQAVGVRKITAG